jgi:hypothetical protein
VRLQEGNEENVQRDPDRNFVFIDVFSFRVKGEGSIVRRGLAAT